MLVLISVNVSAQQSSTREYQVKAAFVYKFTQFVEWPASSFEGVWAPFVIGIMGEDPFGAFIDTIVAGEKVKGRRILIHRYSSFKDIGPCHILYISLVSPAELSEYLAVVRSSILTVSDNPDFNAFGGMIRLITKSNKINFMINPSAAKAADLNISSKLLNVAEIFTGPRK